MADNTHTPQEAYDMMEYQVKQGNLKPSNFVQSMMTQFRNKNHLSAKQIHWAVKLSKEAGQAAIDAQDTEMQMSEMESEGPFKPVVSFMTDADLKSPKLYFKHGKLDIRMSLAPSHGRNPNHIYVKANSKYVGKITPSGDFMTGRDGYYASGVKVILADMVDDVKSFVTSHGIHTGNCCLCNRELTDERSLAVGVGPVCAKNWGIKWG